MKRKLFRTALSIIGVLCLSLSLSFSSLADCLSVRQYGYHKYDNRIYTYNYNGPEWTTEFYSCIRDYGGGHYLSQLVRRHSWNVFCDKDGECVCGARKLIAYRQYVTQECRDEYLNSYMEVLEDGITRFY